MFYIGVMKCFKCLFCSIVLVGTRKNGIFPKFVKLDTCDVANLLEVFEGYSFGCIVCISFHVRMFIIIYSAPVSKKNQFRGLVIKNVCFLHFLREVGSSKFFLGGCTLFAVFWYIFFVLELPLSSCSV